MLIHGRILLTSNGLMLDEAKSLLQKSLRRKDLEFITQSAKELLGYGKDQLPWKSITTFLFEDHCLSHVSVLEKLYQCFSSSEKYRAIEILANTQTCRIAACLPVISLDDEYAPDFINPDPDLKIPETEQRLVSSTSGQLNFDLICAHLKKAWTEKDTQKLIVCMKMISMINDVEKINVTTKGCKYLIREPKKPNVGHVVMTLLFKLTTDPYFKRYFRACFNLLTTPEVCVRLVLFAPVTHLMFFDHVVDPGDAPSLPWKNAAMVTSVPHWAVDKHTFRGKTGKGVKHLIKNKMTHTKKPELFDEFYGERPKSDIQVFFVVGCVCNKQSVEVNPYWERTKQIYFEQTKSKQKTVKMTADYYKMLKKTNKHIFIEAKSKKSTNAEGDISEHRNGTNTVKSTTRQSINATSNKRKTASVEKSKREPPAKRQKLEIPATDESTEAQNKTKPSTNSVAQNEPKSKSENQISFSSLKLKGPLLQLPTGSAKVYACVDVEAEKVWKGPYRENRLHLALFLHRAMHKMGDPHTLTIENHNPYLVFPLLKSDNASLKTTDKSFYDAISKKSIPDGRFMNREDLGIVQLHRLRIEEICKLPLTIWVHFCYRFALNVGDSGIYNAITTKNLSPVYGIDLEEMRTSVKGTGIIDLMFTKRPSKALCSEILKVIKRNRTTMQGKLDLDKIDVDSIEEIANDLDVDFNREQFCKRIKQIWRALAKSKDE